MLHSLETVAPRKSVEAELDVVEQKMKVTLMDKIGIVSILAPRQEARRKTKGAIHVVKKEIRMQRNGLGGDNLFAVATPEGGQLKDE